MKPKYRAFFKGKMWNVETLFMGKEHLGARLGRYNEDNEYEWDFDNIGTFDLMSSTGLKDKRGIVVFEDDFIKYRLFGSDEYSLVAVNEERTGFTPFIGINVGYKWIHVQPEFVEVVGNKHENPKVLDLIRKHEAVI